jgi:hypothetical protein
MLPQSSLFYPEDGSSRFLQSVAIYLRKGYGVTTKETILLMVTGLATTSLTILIHISRHTSRNDINIVTKYGGSTYGFWIAEWIY